MDHWSAFHRDASRIQGETASDCSKDLSLLTDAFELFASAFAAIPTSAGGPAGIARLAILSQALNSFHVMISSATRGFYVEALIPLRHAYEAWLSFWYLAKFPDEAERWLNPTWEMRPPTAETMVNKIDHPSKHMKSKIRGFYEELNRFAHIDPAAVLSRLNQEGDKTFIGVGIRFDAEDFRACTYGLSLWLGNFIDAASALVPPSNEWHSRNQPMADRILAFIDDYNHKHSGSPLPPETIDAA